MASGREVFVFHVLIRVSCADKSSILGSAWEGFLCFSYWEIFLPYTYPNLYAVVMSPHHTHIIFLFL